MGELERARLKERTREVFLGEVRASLRRFIYDSLEEQVGAYEHGDVYGQLRHEINTFEINSDQFGLTARRRTRRKIGPGKRLRVFKRDSFACVICGWKPPDEREARRRVHKRSGQYLTIGHKVPVVFGGSNELSNLQTECYDCNQGRGKELPEGQSGRLLDRLSAREREILISAAAGETARHTAERLGISFETVKTHRKAILAKLDVKRMTEATALVLSRGEIEPQQIAAVLQEEDS